MDAITLNLDGTILKDKEELHNTIAWQLSLPSYYGRNLDALWDVLSTWSKPLRIEVTAAETLRKHLGPTADGLLQLLKEAAEENTVIQLEIVSA